MKLHRELLILLFRLVPDPDLLLLDLVSLLQAVDLTVDQTVEYDSHEEHEAEDNGDVHEELLIMPYALIIPAGGDTIPRRGGIGTAAVREAVAVRCANVPESIHVYYNS